MSQPAKTRPAAKATVQFCDAKLLLEAEVLETAWRFEVAACRRIRPAAGVCQQPLRVDTRAGA